MDAKIFKVLKEDYAERLIEDMTQDNMFDFIREELLDRMNNVPETLMLQEITNYSKRLTKY